MKRFFSKEPAVDPRDTEIDRLSAEIVLLQQQLGNYGLIGAEIEEHLDSEELRGVMSQEALGRAQLAVEPAILDERVAEQALLLEPVVRQRIENEYDTPERRAEIEAIARAKIATDGTEDSIRARVRLALLAAGRTEVEDEARKRIEAEEANKRDEDKPGLKASIRETQKMADHRKKVRSKRRSWWRKLKVEEVMSEIEDEEDKVAMQERVDQVKEEAARKKAEMSQEQLTEAFFGVGVGVSSIPINSKLTIYLGEKTKGSKSKTAVNRVIIFVSHGEGKYVVESDTWANHSEALYRQHALPEETLLNIGCVLLEEQTIKYQPRIRAGSRLHFDAEPSTPDTFEDTTGEVVNLRIDDLAAQKSDSFTKRIAK